MWIDLIARLAPQPGPCPDERTNFGFGEADALREHLLERMTRIALECSPERFVGHQSSDNHPIRWGLGYALDNPMLQKAYGPAIAGRRVAYWGGSGGSAVLSYLDQRMTVAFVMNKHVEAGGWDHRSVEIVQAAYESLAVAALR